MHSSCVCMCVGWFMMNICSKASTISNRNEANDIISSSGSSSTKNKNRTCICVHGFYCLIISREIFCTCALWILLIFANIAIEFVWINAIQMATESNKTKKMRRNCARIKHTWKKKLSVYVNKPTELWCKQKSSRYVFMIFPTFKSRARG